MDVQKQIEIYAGDVTRKLPRKMRADVGDELRALLSEELQGKTPDEATAALRAFGRPADVAARYHPMFAIVDPSDTRAFLTAALAGAIVLALIAAPVIARYGRDALNLLMLAWLGALVCWFGTKSWIIRHWPAGRQWRPRDRDVANRFGSIAIILVILLGMVCYGAPQDLFAALTHGGKLAPVLAYTDEFRTQRLPWLLGAWSLSVLLFMVLLIEGRWRPTTRRAAAAINIATIAILIWFRFGGPMFEAPQTDMAVKGALAFIVGVMLIATAVTIYNAPGRGGKSAAAQRSMK